MINDISRLIYRSLVGTITDDERQRLEAWMAESEENRQAVSRLTDRQYLKREYRRKQAVDVRRPQEDMQRRIGAPKASARTIPLSWRRYVAAAAVVLLIAGTGMYIYNKVGLTPEPAAITSQRADTEITHGTTQAVLTLANGQTVSLGADEAANADLLAQLESVTEEHAVGSSNDAEEKILTTPRGGEFKVVLEDGTEVWLNAESQLRYPDEFEGEERRVEISGEAYFRVAKDEQRPFFVETAGQLIRVTGTEFNVNSYSDNQQVLTTLVSGGITTRLLNGNGGELVLTPGHQTVMQMGSDKISVRSVDTDIVTSWTRGKFVFENQTLEQMMRTLSRWYDFQYEFLDDESRQTVFMGSMPRYGNFPEVLEILEKSGGLKFRQRGKSIAISKK